MWWLGIQGHIITCHQAPGVKRREFARAALVWQLQRCVGAGRRPAAGGDLLGGRPLGRRSMGWGPLLGGRRRHLCCRMPLAARLPRGSWGAPQLLLRLGALLRRRMPREQRQQQQQTNPPLQQGLPPSRLVRAEP